VKAGLAAALLSLSLRLAHAGPALSSAPVSDIHDLSGLPLPLPTEALALTAFPERLVYDVSWGLLSVGQATLSVEEAVEFSGRTAYHVVSRAVSNGFCDAFYKVRDLNESWVDALTLTSLGYAKKLREGHFFRDEWVAYDPGRRQFFAKTVNRDSTFSVKAGTIPAAVQDILSSLYYVRSQPLEPGGSVILDVNTKDNWPLVVRVVKRETIRTPAGTFKTVLVEPALRAEGLFIQKGRNLQVWLSDDPRRVPVLMKVEVFFGHVTARLSKML
jgi:hypothetical protein